MPPIIFGQMLLHLLSMQLIELPVAAQGLLPPLNPSLEGSLMSHT